MFLGWSVHLDIHDRCVADCSRYTFFIIPEVHGPLCVTNDLIKLCRLLPTFFVYISHPGRMSYFQPHNNTGQAPFCSTVPTDFPSRNRQSQPLGHKSPPDRLNLFSGRGFETEGHAFAASSVPQIELQGRMMEKDNGPGGFLPPLQTVHGQATVSSLLCLDEPGQTLHCLISSSVVSYEENGVVSSIHGCRTSLSSCRVPPLVLEGFQSCR